MKPALQVLMTSPDYFDIVDEKNIHMTGQLQKINKDNADKQWQNLYEIYTGLLKERVIEGLSVIHGLSGCEDMVFAANQSLPFIDKDGKKKVIISNMKHASRQREIPAFETFYRDKGYDLIYPPESIVIEGMGDILPVPDTDIWLAGFGQRTQFNAIAWLKGILPGNIRSLSLENPYFYHLDTCLIPVNTHTALYSEQAFNEEGMQVLKQTFTNLISVPLEEARDGFALNAHLINGHNRTVAIIQKGNVKTIDIMKQLHIDVIEVDTSEYMRSGGSVFCMKMMTYA